uniref:interleukin-6-like n=1 Tax=Doryrhamphus excisus TaxID=161450 RepID=UPI0025AEB8AF|nr:interleukin-6-like [Doryrhamphus excisus]
MRQAPRDPGGQQQEEAQPNQRRNMSTEAHIHALAAWTLAALMLCGTGAPLTEAPSALPLGVEEMEHSDPTSSSPVWDSVIRAAKHHKETFEDEFPNKDWYPHVLENYRVTSLPAKCPNVNFSKEACLHRMAQGLSFYTSLLKHVEKAYPSSVMLFEAKRNTGLILSFIRQKMKKPDQVTSLSSSEEETLLSLLRNDDTFHSKMTAHSILRELYIFLMDGKRALARKERRRGSAAINGGVSLLV